MCIGDLSKRVIYVQQVFSIQQDCTLVEFSWFSLSTYFVVCLFVSLETFILVMFLVPRDSLVHWGSMCVIYVQWVFSTQQDSTLVGWILFWVYFTVCIFLFVCPDCIVRTPSLNEYYSKGLSCALGI